MKNLLTSCCVVAILAAVTAAASQGNYCYKGCKNYNTGRTIPHIGCNDNKSFAESCPNNAEMVTMTDSLKQLLIDGHNERRNFVAGGGDRNHRPACAMPVMLWNDELAELSALNVKQCQARHDKCHDTPTFETSGQNIYLKFTEFDEPIVFNDTVMLQESIEQWYAEIQDCSQEIIDAYRPNYDGTKNGHFTVMMSDKNTHLGCAAATYRTGIRYHYLVTCNYAYDNVLTTPVYEACNSPAIKCASGRHHLYNNLCVSDFEEEDISKKF